ncbi:hypothetical protein [Bifidobacterium merycicum]|uniref:hypothetical protein n=1 Tax=Bifidobacterium merycicum TaxID=78345 RepID=UPI0023F04F80|nr:hypothetical protein [Bifidobacterium merycicum]
MNASTVEQSLRLSGHAVNARRMFVSKTATFVDERSRNPMKGIIRQIIAVMMTLAVVLLFKRIPAILAFQPRY